MIASLGKNNRYYNFKSLLATATAIENIFIRHGNNELNFVSS